MAAQSLEVTLGNLPVGTLVRTRKGARFSYAQDLVDSNPGLPILSLSLPVKRRPYQEGRTEAWFGGLLPEGERLERICRELHCPDYDYFGILEKIGWECAGAVSIRTKGSVPPNGTQSIALSSEKLSERIANLPTLVQASPIERVSLGGFQDKLVLQAKDVVVNAGFVREAHWFLPDAATVSTHILKPQSKGRYRGLVEGEAWAMSVAKCAARTSNVALLELEGAPITLVVERYDRMFDESGTYARVHQEDCCQALGLMSSEKYAGYDTSRGSDPTYGKIATLLARYAASPDEELDELLRQMVVNLAMGNADAHAKNYSLLYRQLGVPELSPLYDVVPVLDIEPRSIYLSIRIGGKILASEVEREDILQEAASWGVEDERAGAVIDQTLDGICNGLEAASTLYPTAAARHEPGVRARLALLRR